MSGFTRRVLAGDLNAETVRPGPEPIWLCLCDPASPVSGSLRITLADDSRERVLFLVHLGEHALPMMIPFGGLLQPRALEIPAELFADVSEQGIGISCPGDHAPAIFLRGHPAHVPHILSGPLPPSEVDFWEYLASPASLQPFGSCEGCVLEALADRVESQKLDRARLEERLAIYFDPDGTVRYRDHLGRERQNAFYGIEAGLPFAALARISPRHPALPRILDFLLNRRDQEGFIRDTGKITTEGMLVVAYVLACIGIALDRSDLLEEARRQALFRVQKLSGDSWIAQRLEIGVGYACRNWSRGVAWYVLGLARLLPLLTRAGIPTSELADALDRALEWLLPLRHPDGYWHCFVDDPTSGSESSGTAGIAAAIALRGAGDIRSSVAWLRTQLAADGCLGNVAPLNKGGESFQREGERTPAPYASGLAGLCFHHDPRANPDDARM